MSEKPVVFISHASYDEELAQILKDRIQQLPNVFKLEVFVSSDADAIGAGSDWFETIIQKLNISEALIVLITAKSIDRPWVWFESGYFWAKREGKRIYPLYAPQVKVPEPLAKLQAKSLGKPKEIRAFIRKFCEQFELGDLDNADYENFISKISDLYRSNNNPAPNKAIAKTELVPKLEQDEEKESIEIIKEFLRREYETYREQNSVPNILMANAMSAFYVKRNTTIYDSRLIYYKELDEKLELPNGTSKRLLVDLTGQFGLIPEYVGTKTIKFKRE